MAQQIRKIKKSHLHPYLQNWTRNYAQKHVNWSALGWIKWAWPAIFANSIKDLESLISCRQEILLIPVIWPGTGGDNHLQSLFFLTKIYYRNALVLNSWLFLCKNDGFSRLALFFFVVISHMKYFLSLLANRGFGLEGAFVQGGWTTLNPPPLILEKKKTDQKYHVGKIFFGVNTNFGDSCDFLSPPPHKKTLFTPLFEKVIFPETYSCFLYISSPFPLT